MTLPTKDRPGAQVLVPRGHHVSFQNANTGRLTEAVYDDVLATATALAAPA